MGLPPDPRARRSITVPAVLTAFILVSALLVPGLVVTAAFDAIRHVVTGKPAMGTRGLLFAWVYLAGEVWALMALALTAPLPHRMKIAATYALQQRWTGWSLTAVTRLFGVEIEIQGDESAVPGPIIVLSRHASLIDTLLPAQIISKRHGIRLRYVLKQELLADPALDIAGNRLPNAFIARSGGGGDDVAAIRRLGSDLQSDEGVLIYPEGTRFSEEKLRKSIRISQRSEADGGRAVPRFRSVLPPRPAGTLALIDSTAADVVVLAHHGLESLSTLADAWRGDLVGSRIAVRLWRIDREAIPSDRQARLEWLMSTWREVDDWVTEKRALG